MKTASHQGRRPAFGGAGRAGHYARRVLALLIGAAFVFPFYWTVVISLGKPGEFSNFPPALWPHWQWSNWSRAWDAAPWVRLFANTVLIASCTVLLCLATSLLAGFAFGVLRFPGRKALTLVVLSVLMMPGTVLIIPDYVLANDLHLLNTYWIQIIPWGASVFGIFLVRQFFLTIPQEILDAAALDGASRLRVLRSIGMPMVRPALLIIAVNVFLGSWNSFLWPVIMTSSTMESSNTVQPVEVGLSIFSSAEGTDFPGLAAAVTFTTLPVMVFFLVLQRQFIRGALSAAGGVRG
ncbi:carbohydrate ABC transporter permease [Streptomyces tateyamensis]|uniref:Carbohydrate ABC transporter permease n=1 Tax=Streptomyces tateyamensis TaxID=565073 RepID=A0A2V4MX55_9ACTN|nr:carbohydrate ABC transporter permease [Streptomyces tateyamensis]PYC74479.1 carbohydrate ABC transporter permease [Streptomyces tateyamensis]